MKLSNSSKLLPMPSSTNPLISQFSSASILVRAIRLSAVPSLCLPVQARPVRVAVFAQGAAAEAAKEAGADIVGMEDLAHEIKGGKMDFDVVIAEPAAMRVVGQLGQILGPRGLMPNPKVGTVTPNVAQAVKNAKAGHVQFRADKAGIIHAPVGRASFEVEQLLTNIKALIEQLNKIKPASTKGVYIRKVAVSSTMGPGVKVDVQTLN